MSRVWDVLWLATLAILATSAGLNGDVAWTAVLSALFGATLIKTAIEWIEEGR